MRPSHNRRIPIEPLVLVFSLMQMDLHMTVIRALSSTIVNEPRRIFGLETGITIKIIGYREITTAPHTPMTIWMRMHHSP